MGAIFPDGEFLPPDTPIGTGCNSSRCITLPNPEDPSIEEPVIVPDESEDSNGTVFNTPTFDPPQKVGSWTGRFPSGASITARYSPDGAASVVGKTGEVVIPPIGFNIKQSTTDVVVPGSIRFTLNGREYVDRQGDLVYDVDPLTNAGTVGGTVNYSGGWTVITDWAHGDGVIDVESLGLLKSPSPVTKLFFRTPGAPIGQASLTVQAVSYEDASLIQATADINGNIDGPLITGEVDVETGVVQVFFGEWVTAAGNEAEWWYNEDAIDENGDIFKPHRIVPSSAFFSAVVLTSIPLDPDILGLDPILLPTDGRVPIFKPGNSLMVVQRNVVQDGSPTAGDVVNLGIGNVKFVRVRDANQAEVDSSQYTINSVPGELQWANPFDLSPYTAPFDIEALSYFKRLASDVQINGRISIASPAPFSMAAADAQIFLASKLIFKPDGGNQDLEALALNLFTQASWTGEWSDEQIGSGTTGQYDDVNFPVGMTNNGSITERWRMEFVSETTVNVIGERFGQLLTAVPISADIAPNNPATGTPYFTVLSGGWSGGWQVGNVVRFNTLGANDPVWLIRSTQPGDDPDEPTDRFIAHLQGDTSQS